MYWVIGALVCEAIAVFILLSFIPPPSVHPTHEFDERDRTVPPGFFIALVVGLAVLNTVGVIVWLAAKLFTYGS